MILLYILLMLISLQSLNIVALFALGIGIVVKLKVKTKLNILFILASIIVILLSPNGRLSGDYRNYLRTYEKAVDSLQNMDYANAVELMSELGEEYDDSDFSNVAKAYAYADEKDTERYMRFIDNKRTTLYYSVAINYFSSYGTPEEFRDCSVEAADRYPNVAEFARCAGKAEFDLGNINEAKYYLSRADKLYDEKNGDIKAMLGVCSYYKMDTDTASKYFEDALTLGVSDDSEELINKYN